MGNLKVDPKDYASTLRSSYINPVETREYQISKLSDSGPREARFNKDLSTRVEENFKKKQGDDYEESRKVEYLSDAHRCYVKENFTPSLNEKPNGRVKTHATDYSTDMPITYYSATLLGDCSSKSIGFPVTFINSVNPFRKNSAFSADARAEPAARKCETNEKPTRSLSFGEFRVMSVLKKRLITHVQGLLNERGIFTKGLAVLHVANILWSVADRVNAEKAPIDLIREALRAEFGFEINDAESRSTLAAFDHFADGDVNIPDLITLIKGHMNNRRMELVGVLYNALLAFGGGDVTSDVISKNFISGPRTGDVQYLLNAMSYSGSSNATFTLEDFIDFYQNVSGELEDNEEFNSHMRSCWRTF